MYEFAPDVFACITGRHCMFLDLPRDRYLCVPRHLMEALSPQIAGWALSDAPPPYDQTSSAEVSLLADDLIAAGILRRSAQHSQSPQRPPVPPEREIGSLLLPSTALDVDRARMPIIAALASADWSLRCVPLPRIIDRFTAPNAPNCSEPHNDNLRHAAALTRQFLAFRPWYPRDYLCLFDSLALLLLLLRRGIRARWIFGVKEDPFAAHCWLQIGTVVLNEHLDRTRLYSPIMMV